MQELSDFGSGSDGVLNITSNTTESVIDSACTGSSGGTSLSATNASFADDQLIFIHQTRGTGAGSWEFNIIDSYVAGTITTVFDLINTYASGAQVRKVNQYSSLTIAAGFTYTVKAWNGTVGGLFINFVSGDTTIEGTLSGKGTNGGSSISDKQGYGGDGGGFRGGRNSQDGSSAERGEGYTGTYTDEGTTNAGNGGGGGSGSAGDNGGAGGGNALAASNSDHSLGGEAVGNAAMTAMFLGGGGGGGRNDGDQTAGGGGNGGAIIYIQSQGIVFGASGLITVNGGNGGTAGGGAVSGGGGGAGGCVFLRSVYMSIGTNRITANGGSKGSNTASDGGRGWIRLESCSIVGSTTQGTINTEEGGHDFCQTFIHIYG